MSKTPKDKDKDIPEVTAVGEVEAEAIHRLRLVPSPTKRYVRDSRLNPSIHLDRCDRIPYVRLDRNEIQNYEKKSK